VSDPLLPDNLAELDDDALMEIWGRLPQDVSWDTMQRILDVIDQHEQAEKRAARAAAAKQRRHEQDVAWYQSVRETWEAASHAQYLRADAYTRGNLLSRKGREVLGDRPEYPFLWEGRRRTDLESEELTAFFDFIEPKGRLTVSMVAEDDKLSTSRDRLLYTDPYMGPPEDTPN
jgi:hypothetical protein